MYYISKKELHLHTTIDIYKHKLHFGSVETNCKYVKY